jgi:acetoin utilization protein AcuB
MTTVGAYMTKAPHTIGVEQSLRVARQMMSQHHVRHLPVLHGGAFVGVLSDRELESFEALPGSSQITVEEAMVADAYVTPSDAPLDAVADEMAKRRLGSAIVVTDSDVVGVFTAVDALRALADALRAPPDGAQRATAG